MFGAMFFESGKPSLRHELLFAGKVHACKLDELIQQLADFLAPAAANKRLTKLIDCVHEDAMLIVHGADTDGTGVIPSKEGHLNLRQKPGDVSAPYPGA